MICSDFGFIQDNGHCIRYKTMADDPYVIPKLCKPGQFYNRTKGYRKIAGDVCVAGFEKQFLPDIIPCPFEEVQEFILFAQRDKIGRFNLLTATKDELPVSNLKNVIAIDFDMQNNCVFWADIVEDNIGRQCLKGGKPNEILVSSNLSSVEGMAYDWISHNLYFVDGMRAVIELIRTDIPHLRHIRKIILSPPILKKPRGIAVHPVAGYLFWTDWSTENPSVSRSNLDGSDVMQLFKQPVVQWPNGIAIDHIAERIYWVDAREDYIGSSDLHGKMFKKIIEKDEFVAHPFSVAIFKDTMYWDDWKRNAIFRADKDRGIDVGSLAHQLSGLMDLKVYAHGLQIGSNACVNATCPYICVAKPEQQGFSCLCPDGMFPDEGGNKCLCPGNVEPHLNMSCPEIESTCGPDYFICGNNLCISKSWRCDGDRDCADGQDEMNCTKITCGSNAFTCGDGKCIPYYWKCDYDKDCSDGSDELDCPKQVFL